jgi:hypothetical protein
MTPGRDKLYNARYWRDRAEEARLMAEDMRDPSAKAALQSIAKSYDQLETLAANRDRPK